MTHAKKSHGKASLPSRALRIISAVGEPEPSNGSHPIECFSRAKYMSSEERLKDDPFLYRLEEEFGPFIHSNKGPLWTPMNVLRAVVGGVFLMPIRLVMLGIALVGFLPFYKIITLGAPRDVPLSGIRRKLYQTVLRLDVRLILLSLGFWKIDVLRIRPSPSATHPYAPLIANHTTFVDICMLMTTEKAVGFVGKSPVRDYPIIGALARGIDTIFVERGDPSSRAKVSAEMLDRATGKHRCPDGSSLPVTVFPEGATTNGDQMITFRTGVFRAGQPVRPVLIRYDTNHWSPSWESVRVPHYLFHMMTSIANHCCVQELPVYEPSPAEQRYPELYAENVRRYMAHAGGLPLSPYSVNDKLAFLGYINRRFTADEAFAAGAAARQQDAEFAAHIAAIRAKLEADEPHSSDPLLLPDELACFMPKPFPGHLAPQLSRRPFTTVSRNDASEEQTCVADEAANC